MRPRVRHFYLEADFESGGAAELFARLRKEVATATAEDAA